MKTIIQQAQDFAHAAHDSIGQKRKDKKTPYWVHTDSVARIVDDYGGDEDQIVAAHLHDVLEDVSPVDKTGLYNGPAIFHTFGTRVFWLVWELTNQYPDKNYAKVTSKFRKLAERRRLSMITSRAKLIKLADILDNTLTLADIRDMPEHKAWVKSWLSGKRELLPKLRHPNNELLWERVASVVKAHTKH